MTSKLRVKLIESIEHGFIPSELLCKINLTYLSADIPDDRHKSITKKI